MINDKNSKLAISPIPQDTVRVAIEDYGEESPYIRFGNELDDLVRDLLNEIALESPSERTSIPNYVYALITYFQFIEQATDEQMAEIIRKRADLRYAIRWHLGFPNIPNATLCEFRRWLFTNPSFHETFISLVNRSSQLIQPDTAPCEPDITHILKTICAVTRVEKAKEQMLLALEALSAEAPEWVRSIAPPYWYDRYSRSPRNIFVANAKKDWLTLLPEIEQDIKILLDAVAAEQDLSMVGNLEIQKLQELWEEQFADPHKKECLLCSKPRL